MLPPVLFLLQIPQMQIHRILADSKDFRGPDYRIFHVVDAFLIKSLDDLLVSVGGQDVFVLNDLACLPEVPRCWRKNSLCGFRTALVVSSRMPRSC